MGCVEEYLFDSHKLVERTLAEILAEDYGFEVEGPEESTFRVEKGFLWCGRHRVMDVDEARTLVLGNRLFVAGSLLEVHSLPRGPVSGDCGDVEEDCGRGCASGGGSELLWSKRKGERLWEWSSLDVDGRRCLSRSEYVVGGLDAARCSERVYARDSEVVLRMQEISVRRDVGIYDPIRVCGRAMRDGVVVVVVTMDAIYMEYGGYVSSKPCGKGMYDVDVDEWRVVGIFSHMDICDLYLTLRLFTDIEVDGRAIRGIEEYLFRLFVFTDRGEEMVKWLVCDGIDKEKEMVLCRLYRKVDEEGKRKLEALVRGVRSLDALRLVIIYFPDEMERYISMCIEERREYEIPEVIEHYRGSDMVDRISLALVRRNCFHLLGMCMAKYEGRFGDVALVEKYNMESQRRMQMALEMEGGFESGKVCPRFDLSGEFCLDEQREV